MIFHLIVKSRFKVDFFTIFSDCHDRFFKQPVYDQPILSSNQEGSEVKVLVDTPEIAKISILQEMEIPVSADERLEKEQRMVVEFRYRKAFRALLITG